MPDPTVSIRCRVNGRDVDVTGHPMMRLLDAKPSRLADYADFRDAMRRQVQIEIVQAQIKEAKRKPKNEPRIRELEGELACLLI